jgi:DNA-binding MarR family transcriptional regulator
MTKDRDALTQTVRDVRLSSVGWHIQRLTGQLDRAMNEMLATHGLTIQKFAILMALIENDGLNQTELGSRFSAPAYTITRMIDALESDGFLERRAHPTSRRTNTVHATAKLIDLTPTLLGIVGDVNARLMRTLDEQERRVMLDLLARVLDENAL